MAHRTGFELGELDRENQAPKVSPAVCTWGTPIGIVHCHIEICPLRVEIGT
jgi:hypothetical protein